MLMSVSIIRLQDNLLRRQPGFHREIQPTYGYWVPRSRNVLPRMNGAGVYLP